MAEKTYVTPLAKEPEFVISPKGATNEVGAKIRRKAIKFKTNARGVGQFSTSDPKVQAFLDEHPWMAAGKLQCVGSQHMAPPEQKQTTGPVTASAPVKHGKKGKGK